MDDFLKQIIEQVKDVLLDGVDEKYHEELLNRYIYSLTESYKGIKIKEESYDEALQDEVHSTKESLSNMAADAKLSFYLKDEAYSKLIRMSNKGLDFAIKRYQTGEILDKLIVEEAIEMMKQLLKNVKNFNMITARIILDDGMMDLNYACGNTDLFSLRMTPYVQNQTMQEEIER